MFINNPLLAKNLQTIKLEGNTLPLHFRIRLQQQSYRSLQKDKDL